MNFFMKFDKLIIKGLDVAKVLSVLLEQLAAAPKNTALKPPLIELVLLLFRHFFYCIVVLFYIVSIKIRWKSILFFF